jgi:hypothetical protein
VLLLLRLSASLFLTHIQVKVAFVGLWLESNMLDMFAAAPEEKESPQNTGYLA